MICSCCMTEHEDQIVKVTENMVFMGVPIKYEAEYHYCSETGEDYADEAQIFSNWENMMYAYAKATFSVRCT